jgi:hypothetical protein
MGEDSTATLTAVAAAIAAAAATGQLIVLVVAAIFAKRQVEEARRLREAQARPFVTIDFHVERTLVFLTIANLGQSLARDVRFLFDPPLRSSSDDAQPNLPPLTSTKIFAEGIPTAGTGQEDHRVLRPVPCAGGAS